MRAEAMTDTTNTAAAGQKMPRKPTGKLAFAYATIMQLEAQVAELRAAIAAQLEVIGAGGVSGPLMGGYSAGDMAAQGAEQFRAGQASMQAGGERYRLLNRGLDVIQADDEFLSEDTTTWSLDPNGIFEGMPYEGYALLPARRKLDAAIAAQQGDSHE